MSDFRKFCASFLVAGCTMGLLDLVLGAERPATSRFIAAFCIAAAVVWSGDKEPRA